MSDHVLLTGISGFLGGHTALELLNGGYHVRGSLRNPAREGAVRAALEAQGADTRKLSFVTSISSGTRAGPKRQRTRAT